MQYRRLGRTELQVSVLGVGGGYVMLLEPERGTRLYQRAYDLGLNYFDGRYGDSSPQAWRGNVASSTHADPQIASGMPYLLVRSYPARAPRRSASLPCQRPP